MLKAALSIPVLLGMSLLFHGKMGHKEAQKLQCK